MKNSSIVVPVILVLCLIALGLLISQALEASKEDQTTLEDNGIYPESPKPSRTDSLAISETQAGNRLGATDKDNRFSDLVPATAADASLTSNGNDPGRYLIFGGTFRQLINARTRVRDLKEAGFTDATLERFDRGTFAVALVNRTATYTDASELAQRVRAAGFEAEVYRKR